MKKVLLPVVLCAIVVTSISCKKEAAETFSADLSAGSSENAVSTSTSKFGVLVVGGTGDDKITVANKLNTSYVRTAIVLTDFSGQDGMMDKYVADSFKVLLNLEYTKKTTSPRPYPTDMTKYTRLLGNVLEVYHPTMAVIENEESNQGYYSGPIKDYITELTNAITVCKQHKVKVSDGGLNAQMVCVMVQQNYVAEGRQKKADNFGQKALTDKNLKLAQGNGSADEIAKLQVTQKLIAAFKTLDLDFVNIHWPEPIKPDDDSTISAPGVLSDVADYLRSATGKKVITNEFKQLNTNPSLITSMVDAFNTASFKYAIEYDGTGAAGNGVPISDGTTLLPNGVAYKKAIN